MKEKLLISFSGGETSAYMTYEIIRQFKDQFEIIIVFANTGEENEETLVFVNECDNYFGWGVVWAGNRWKVGDKFSPRIWSGLPYRSKQIPIGPDIEIKKIWDVEFDAAGVIAINGFYTEVDYEIIAQNDGLSIEDFYHWFPMDREFFGQIICWNGKINY